MQLHPSMDTSLSSGMSMPPPVRLGTVALVWCLPT